MTAYCVRKVASKFTEVGYVGRDVDSIVRDLVEVAVKLVRDEDAGKVRGRAKDAAEDRLLELLQPRGRSFTYRPGEPASAPTGDATREKLRTMLRDGKLDDREVEVEMTDDANPLVLVLGGQPGIDENALSVLKDMFGALGRKTKRQKLKVPQAWRTLTERNQPRAPRRRRLARRRAARSAADRRGLDGDHQVRPGAHRSRAVHRCRRVPHEQAQRSIPEMQGRFAIHVELTPLVANDFVRIPTEPKNALTGSMPRCSRPTA